MSKRKYEVEIMVVQNKIYHVYAEDEADLMKNLGTQETIHG